MSFLGDDGVPSILSQHLSILVELYNWYIHGNCTEHVTPDFLHGQFFLLLQCVWHLQGMTANTVKGEGLRV